MRDFLSIGPVPFDEDCAQVGSPDYHLRARPECKRFIAQILRHYPDDQHSGYLSIKHFPHEHGTYVEVCAVFDDEDEASINWAFSIEADDKGVLSRWEE